MLNNDIVGGQDIGVQYLLILNRAGAGWKRWLAWSTGFNFLVASVLYSLNLSVKFKFYIPQNLKFHSAHTEKENIMDSYNMTEKKKYMIFKIRRNKV